MKSKVTLYHFSPKYLLSLITLLSSLVCIPVIANEVAESIGVDVFEDKSSAGWAWKKSDIAYRVVSGDCEIQWNAVVGKESGRYLSVRRHCKQSFSDQIKLHRAILDKVNRSTRLSEFDYVIWGSFCPHENYDWCLPVAKASLESEDYLDYKQNYPNSRITSLNQLFVDLANEHQAYQPLKNLFDDYGVELTLSSVEKVFALKLSELDFADQFDETTRSGNPRVMFDVGMSYFNLSEKD